jgi:hypothetical protein
VTAGELTWTFDDGNMVRGIARIEETGRPDGPARPSKSNPFGHE